MDKAFSITQLIIAAVIFSCLAGVIGHIVLGHITSILGYLVSLLFVYLSWVLLRLSYKELRENR